VADYIQFFPGQAGGQAISDALFGLVSPGGRVPISVPYSVGTLPAFYKYVSSPSSLGSVLTHEATNPPFLEITWIFLIIQ
jgi:hypothetical protein